MPCKMQNISLWKHLRMLAFFFFFFSYKNIKITVHILTMKAKLPIKKSTLTTLQYCIYAANLVTYSQNKLQESMHTLNFFCIFLVLHNNPDVFVL